MTRKSSAVEAKNKRGFPASRGLVIMVVAVAVLAVAFGGCGLETDQANEALGKTAKSQQEAEDILDRVRNFPAEWEAIFNVPRVGPEQVSRARQLLQARTLDLRSLEKALKKWGTDLKPIKKMNVEEKIREYVKLKLTAVNGFSEYVTSYLRPAMKAYSKLLDMIAAGRPLTELNNMVQEITALSAEATAKLEECQSAEKQADDYFQENKLGY